MAAARLNVEIRADAGGLLVGLKKAEAALADFGKKMQSSGSGLMSAFTLPLGAIAAASIKAAGDYENLRNAMITTMTDAGRSTQDALAEVEALRKAALAPGLDFEQAVKASIRLQNVGYSAEAARKIVTELANAITMSGGSADDLDGVTKQFTQMISKGRVLQEDLSIIAERMPKIAELSKNAFGTFNAEALRAQGISAQEFVAGITAEMTKLGRVQGGISNAIVNAGTSIKQFLGVIGAEINKVFNIGQKSEQFSKWLENLGMKFQSLDDETKRWIVGLGAALVAIGPIVKVVGVLSSGFGMLTTGLVAVSKAMKVMADFTMVSVQNFQKMNVVTKGLALLPLAFIAWEVGKALYSVVDSLIGYNKEAEVSKRISEKLTKIQSDVTDEYSKEAAVITQLFATATNYRISTDERSAALKKLKEQYPEYIGNLDLEKMSLQELGGAQEMVLANLKEGIKQRIKQASIVSELEKQAKAEMRLNEIRQKGFQAISGQEMKQAGMSLFGTDFEKQFWSEDGKKNVIAKVNQMYQDIISETSQTVKSINDTFGGVSAADSFYAFREAEEGYKKTISLSKDQGKQVQANNTKLSEQAKLYKEILAAIEAAKESGKVLGDAYERQADAIGNGLEKLLEKGFKADSPQVKNLLKMAQDLRDTLGGIKGPQSITGNATAELKALEDSANALSQALAKAKAGGIADPNALDAVVKQAEALRDAMQAAQGKGIGANDTALRGLVDAAMMLKETLSTSQLPIDFAGSSDALAELLAQAVALKLALEGAKPGDDLSAMQAQAEALAKALNAVDMPALPESAAQLEKMRALAMNIGDTLAVANSGGIEQSAAALQTAAMDAGTIRTELAGTKLNEEVFGQLTQQADAAIQKLKELKDSVSAGLPALPSNTALSPVVSQTPNTKNPVEGLTMPVKPIDDTTEAMKRYIDTAREMGAANMAFREGLVGFNETWKNTFDLIMANGTVMQKVGMQIGASMMDAASQGATSFKELARAAVGSAAKVVRAWIQQGVAGAVAKALQSLPFPLNLVAGGAAGAAAGVLFNKALGALKIPALAGGGLAMAPTLAMVGDNPGAGRGNPEVIAPLNKLQDMIGGNGGVYIVGGEIRWDGRSLVLAMESGQRQLKRSRG